MEASPANCPSCGGPVRADAPFCGQCGFDLPAGDPATRPPPEKCPFCGKPTEGEELACRQCGFDFGLEWEPEGANQGASFAPNIFACRDCGQLNPEGFSFCSKCNAPISSTIMLAPGIEGVQFTGHLYRRLVGPIGTLPGYARLTRIILGAATVLGAAGCVVGAVVVAFSEASPWALVFIPVLALDGWFGYLVMFGRRPQPAERCPHQSSQDPDEPFPKGGSAGDH